MKQIELSPRLQMVADLIPQGANLADVGTDHAYLPAALMQQGRIRSAIAADLRQGPLSRAKATVQEYGLQGKIGFRLCDGLKGIEPHEVDTVSIAGMGGETIAMILEAAPWTRERNTTLVLQPMSSMPELRLWLEEHGYCIAEERLAQEGDTLYTAFLVKAGTGEPLSVAQRWVGRNSAQPLRGAWLDEWSCRISRAKSGMEQAKQDTVAKRLREMEEVLSGIEKMKQEWEAWQL